MENYLGTERCVCGKNHDVAIDAVVIGKGVLKQLPEFVARYGAKKPFVLCDCNTYKAAGQLVCNLLAENKIAYSKYIFPQKALEPDEQAVGSAVMHFDNSCDLIIGVGSGVINDIGKILSNVSGRKYIIVGTAPSMDGYASATSSMSMDGLKVSLGSRCADVIIGDVDILKNAPEHMLKAGLGDMLAKYVSIAEWRIAHLITGEYYCERVAQLIRDALKKCVDNADGLLRRDEKAIEAVFEGLVIGGVAMAYAGVSRPASGVEHYFSHVWDMRGLEFGTQVDLHGIQCAMATLQAAKLYDQVRKLTPNKEKAAAYVDAFDWEDWKGQLRSFLGNSGETMIAQEMREQKYNKTTHPARFAVIEENWDAICKILDEELPPAAVIDQILDTIGISSDLQTIGVDTATARMTFRCTKDIRDKYVLSRLAWDLGVLDELCEEL
ncbi:MAG: sn-glycerol-1-phosphate dehydrogenase [Oscillospiraceae bacterium]|nr:sn-glycerol-1-phosphate dehydrogenase [Oscillospiraceae bacterium]